MMYGLDQVRKDNSLLGSAVFGYQEPSVCMTGGVTLHRPMTYPIHSKVGNVSYKNTREILNITAGAAYFGGVLGLDNMVYLIPSDSTTAGYFNPYTEEYETFGPTLSSSSSKWQGGVLANDGHIYAVPYNETSILHINPTSKIVEEISNPIVFAYYKYTVLASNGLIYGFGIETTPGYILEFDPVSRITTEYYIGVGLTIGGAVVAPNGNIYTIPYNTNEFMVFNPITKKVKIVDAGGPLEGSSSSNSRFVGGVLGPDGRIYCIPSSQWKVLVIEPGSDKSWYLESYSLGGDTLKYRGGVLGPDGCIYGIPGANTKVLRIDPYHQSLEQYGNLSGTSQKWMGGVLHPNGHLYGITYSGDTILDINFGVSINRKTCLSKDLNKF